jgi:hypothetical protein
MISQAYVKDAFDYNPITGVVTWKERPLHHFKNRHGQALANARYANTICSGTGSYGYIQIKLAGKRYRLHRMVWLWYYGDLPPLIDHINGSRRDNRICNLRGATTKRQNATSKLKGGLLAQRGKTLESPSCTQSRETLFGILRYGARGPQCLLCQRPRTVRRILQPWILTT